MKHFQLEKMLKNTKSPVILLFLFFHIVVQLQLSSALKCRSEDGPTEAELKRVTRSCMRKVAENVQFNGGSGRNGGGVGVDDGNNNGFSNNGYNGASNSNFHYGSSNGYHYNNNNNNYWQKNNYRSDYDSDEDSDVSENGAYNYERNGNNAAGGRDIFQQRNREKNPILNNRNGSGNGGNNGNSNTGGRSNGNFNSNTGNGNNNNSGNQRNSNQKPYNNGRSNLPSQNNKRDSMNTQSNDNNRNNGTIYDTGCVVHCFFEELSMLNKDDYPDKHKVIYMLTKDLRDRELRNFYTDTIQSCFRYMDSQRRREKCQFSRELIQCMAEHAKANCDDWEEYNVMFN